MQINGLSLIFGLMVAFWWVGAHIPLDIIDARKEDQSWWQILTIGIGCFLLVTVVFYFIAALTNPKVCLYVIGIYSFFAISNIVLGKLDFSKRDEKIGEYIERHKEKSKIMEIFKIYKKLKLNYPKINEEEILRKTASTYFKSLGWNLQRTDLAIDSIFERNVDDLKQFTNSLLTVVNPIKFSGGKEGIHPYLKKKDKRFNEIVESYNKFFR